MSNTAGQTTIADSTSSNYGWTVMGVMWSVNFFLPMVVVSLGIMLPTMKEDLGITPVQAGMLGSAFFIGSATMSLPASVWLSRYSPKMITGLALTLAGILALIQGWAPTYAILLASRFLFTLAMVARVQAEVLLIQQWFNPKRVALIVSITVGVFSCGQLAAVGLTSSLMDLLSGWRQVYYVVGAILLLGALLWVFMGKDRIPTASDDEHVTESQSPLGILRRMKVLWVLAACPAGAALAWASVLTFWPTHALDSLSLSLTNVGALMTLFPLGGIAASFLAGPLSDKIRQRRIFIWAPGIMLPPIYVGLFTVTSPVLAAILLLLAGWNAMIWVPIVRTIPFDLKLAPRETAVVVGLFMTIMPLGGAVGPLLVGFIQELTGSLQYGLLSIAAFPLTLSLGGLLIPETSPYRTELVPNGAEPGASVRAD